MSLRIFKAVGVVLLIFQTGCGGLMYTSDISSNVAEVLPKKHLDQTLDKAICFQFEDIDKKIYQNDEYDEHYAVSFFRKQIFERSGIGRDWKLSCQTGSYRYLVQIKMTSSLNDASATYRYIYRGAFFLTLGIVPLYSKIGFVTKISDQEDELFNQTSEGPFVGSLLLLPVSPFLNDGYDEVKNRFVAAFKFVADKNSAKTTTTTTESK